LAAFSHLATEGEHEAGRVTAVVMNELEQIGGNEQRVEPLALLVVEDSLADARLLQEHLREAIAQGEVILQVARTLAEARQLLGRVEFSCVLVDLGLPDAQGSVVVEGLRGVDPDVPMIALTARDDDELALNAIQLGVQDCVVKGRYDSDLMLRRVRFVVQQAKRLTQLEHLRNESFHSASHDNATGLPNRQLFEDHARLALALAERSSVHPSILFINVDGYAGCYDEYGEPMSSVVIKTTARLLATVVRKTDTVAYWGDGNFAAVLFPTSATTEPVAAARRFLRKLRELDFAPAAITFSIGVAIFPEHGRSFENLLENSEQAMYRARRDLGGVALWTAPPLASAVSGDLSPTAAVDAHSAFELEFQPWVDLRQMRFAGIQARVPVLLRDAHQRLDRAQRWEIQKMNFRRATSALQRWREQGLIIPALSVGVDECCLEQNLLPGFLIQLLRDSGLSPADLRLEINAACFSASRPEQLDQLAQLHDLQLPIVIDDFITSGDGLLLLSTIPLEGVKLSHELLKMLPGERIGSNTRRLVAAAIGAASGLGIDVIAGGVETPQMQQALRTLGCRYAQGNLYGTPVTSDVLPQRWLSGP